MMRSALIAVAASAAPTGVADAAPGEPRDESDIRGVVGILATPAIALECTPAHREWRPQDAADCPELSLPLRARPRPDADIVAVLDLDNYPFTHEYDYEALGVLAYGAADGWRYVRSEADGGWLAPDHMTDFVAYPDRIVGYLAYFNSWNGVVHDAPGGAAASPLDEAARQSVMETGANVAADESLTVDGALWFRITVYDSSQCGGDPEPLLEDVWVPGYQADDANTLWFYSRGC